MTTIQNSGRFLAVIPMTVDAALPEVGIEGRLRTEGGMRRIP
jgi:hypothetical protein